MLSSQHVCKAVHVAMTPLAGSPIRIVQALNKYTKTHARLLTVNEYPISTGRSFPTDLCWWIEADRENFLSILDTTDVIHLHHWIHLEQNALGINFASYLARGKKIIRQFHSNPNFVAHHANVTPDVILHDPIPQLTLPQFHERYYPRARLVPNIVPIEDPLYANASPIADTGLSVYYRPSGYASAWSDRWETKGAPEVMSILDWATQNIPGIVVDAELKGLPYEEHIRRRAKCHLDIDDVVTGSFHLNSLEALAQSRAVICYLDTRQMLTLAQFTGCSELPFINFPLEDLAVILNTLSKNLTLVQELGHKGRQWMERYWHPRVMAEHYATVYNDLLTKAPDVFFQPRFDVSDFAARWMSSESEDLRWLIRRARVTNQ